MSDYRRLISYIYAYEGGVKGKNIGYAKVEIRGGQCRIQVNVKKVFVGSNETGVYLLAPEAEILLGRIFIRGGAGEFRTQVNAENVEGSGIAAEQFYGLTIHDVTSTWRSYTTVWEDAVAQTAEVQLADITSENMRKRDGSAEAISRALTMTALRRKAETGRTGSQSAEVLKTEQELEETGQLQITEEAEPEEQEAGTEEVFDAPNEIQNLKNQEEPEAMTEEASEIWSGNETTDRMQKEPETEVGEEVLVQSEEKPEDPIGQGTEEQMEEPAEEVLQAEKDEEPAGEQQIKKILEQHLPVSAEIERELKREEERLETIAPWEEEEKNPDTPKETQPASGSSDAPINRPSHKSPGRTRNNAAAARLSRLKNILQPGVLQSLLLQPDESQTAPPASIGPGTVGQEVRSQTANMKKEQETLYPELENPEVLRELERQEAEENNRSDLWERLQRKYTRVLAFEYDNGCEILSIKPQDIGLLPREIWVYGNNSFLLHGYYNYRHLILARLSDSGGKTRYLLGVPGHYFSNEKYMASMFGFPHFVLAKKQPDEGGRFGYWYTDIRL